MKELFNPQNLCSSDILFSRNTGVPFQKGIYAWFSKTIPPTVPVEDCIKINGYTLLYIGIAPVGPTSMNTLRRRLYSHFKGNAGKSTLRLSLGCLLNKELGFTLQETGKTKRLTFGNKEQVLSEWMSENCKVSWILHSTPWELEKDLFKRYNCPLNIAGNKHNPFAEKLLMLRKNHKTLLR